MKNFLAFALVSASLFACGGETANTDAKTAADVQPTASTMAATTAAPAATPAPAAGPADIVDTAVANGKFKTLAAALTKAGLIDTLKGPGPFTVFAPTDDAFAAVPKADLDALLANQDKLKSVLTYHVVAGKVMAADVVKMTSGKTVQGADVAIKVSGSTVMINKSKVIMTDIVCKNGVIHVIDAVLMPPAK
jgi:uncharacterized surface protein with fasciclin (FAS1) repeats